MTTPSGSPARAAARRCSAALRGLAALGASLFATMLAPLASAQTFSNTAAINVPVSVSDGQAATYPSTINVAGLPTSLGYITVTLNNLSHTWASDLNVLLVSPTGQRILLMANTNGNDTVSGGADNVTLTFVPDATFQLPSTATPVVSGVYSCTAYAPPAGLPGGPAGPYGTSLAPLIGTNPNGAWSLYVYDDFAASDNGSIAGGWSITFNQTLPFNASSAFTYQGQLAINGSPLSGNVNARFTVCNSAVASASVSAVAAPITKSFTGVANGLITTSLDFGTALDVNRALWLDIQVESPPGSGYVTLSPRQPITATPQARIAQWAQNAQSASTAPWSGITGVPASVTNAFSPWIAGGGSSISYTQGPVGIGTATPGSSYVLETRSTGDTEIALSSGPASGGATAPRTWTIQSSNVLAPAGPLTGSFQIIDRSAGASRLLINTSGQIGMGTNTPNCRLTVSDNTILVGQFESSFPSGTWLNIVNSSTGGRSWRLISTGSGNGEGTGNLAIGTGSSPASNATAMSILSSNLNLGIGTNTPTQKLHVNGNVLANNVAVPSSGRFKHNVMPMGDALERLMRLEGVTFDWNSEFAKDRPGREHDIGFVAEDVAKVFPEVVFKDPEGLVTGMDYSRLTAVAVQAIKQQQAQREADLARAEAERTRLDAELTRQRAENAELKARLAVIEAALSEMRKNK
jgi:subtilisin-like proprotein convertase family protein